jgi:hypothetical protein
MVIDKPDLSTCSRVAAGIWNPVVFKRLTKSWMIDDLLPEMMSFYRFCEKEMNAELITERNIIKFFSEEHEAELWWRKAQGELKGYLDQNIETFSIKGVRSSGLGFSKVLRSGNLNIPVFLNKTRERLERENSFTNEEFDFGQLKCGDKVSYKEFVADKIIFSEGYKIKDNPFFNYIPFKPAKGEVLTIECDALQIGKDIINKNMFVMPLENHIFKAGATYNWEQQDDHITTTARMELDSKLQKLLDLPYRVLSQDAGVRPSVIDRRPVVGRHPAHESVYVFNGMGTKGVMLAPYFAKQLANHLSGNGILNPEADVQRFNKFFVN